MSNRNMVTGTGSKGIQVSEDVARLLDLRREGVTLKDAAAMLDIPYNTAQEWIKKYIRHVSTRAVVAFRDQELKKLEDLEERILEVLNREHYALYQGFVVKDLNGQPLIDSDPIVRAVVAYLKISERKARMMGADRAPLKDEGAGADQKDKDDAAKQQVLTPALFEELVRRLGVKTGMRLDEAAIDVTPRPVPVQQSTTTMVDPLVEETR